MIKTQKTYQTSDGSVFTDKMEAVQYEWENKLGLSDRDFTQAAERAAKRYSRVRNLLNQKKAKSIDDIQFLTQTIGEAAQMETVIHLKEGYWKTASYALEQMEAITLNGDIETKDDLGDQLDGVIADLNERVSENGYTYHVVKVEARRNSFAVDVILDRRDLTLRERCLAGHHIEAWKMEGILDAGDILRAETYEYSTYSASHRVIVRYEGDVYMINTTDYADEHERTYHSIHLCEVIGGKGRDIKVRKQG